MTPLLFVGNILQIYDCFSANFLHKFMDCLYWIIKTTTVANVFICITSLFLHCTCNLTIGLAYGSDFCKTLIYSCFCENCGGESNKNVVKRSNVQNSSWE